MKKRKKNMFAQVMAWLALFAIIIGIVGTGILVLFSSGQESDYGSDAQILDQEELQRIINESSVEVNVGETDQQTEDVTSTGVTQ